MHTRPATAWGWRLRLCVPLAGLAAGVLLGCSAGAASAPPASPDLGPGAVAGAAGAARRPPGAAPAADAPWSEVAFGGGCDAARMQYEEHCRTHVAECTSNDPPDPPPGTLAAILNEGNYLDACDTPRTTRVAICVALQHGQAVGVTVATSPADDEVAQCIVEQVRALPLPNHPRMMITRTKFDAS